MYKMEILRGKRRGGTLPPQLCDENYEKVKEFHRESKTPMVSIEETAKLCHVKDIYLKDESKRYGLNAFKALGAMYAIDKIVKEKGEDKDYLFVTATDGNHGKAVAFSAAKKGCRSVIFMPKGTVAARKKAIEDIEGATVYLTDLNYDDAVRKAMAYADENDGIFVQDTGFAGYEDIPWDITLGYTKLAMEIEEDLGDVIPTHIFLQAGVGSMAGGVTGYFVDKYGDKCPKIVIMEAYESACIYKSAEKDGFAAIGGFPETIMAGLNCGEPNALTLPVLLDHASYFVKVPDNVTEDGMRRLGKEGITAGECGGIGTGLLMNLTDEMRDELGINEDSVIVLISTEGDTDPETYARIVRDV